MNPLSREDFIELGVSIPAAALVGWASGQLAATKGKESRLQTRGVNGPTLEAIRDLAAIVEKRAKELGDGDDLPPQAVAVAQHLREEALAFRRTGKLMANAEFGTRPDLLAKFRTGVQTGLLLANLTKELETLIALLREHAASLAGIGATEPFMARGELLVEKLKDAKAGLDAACRALSPSEAQQCHDKGLLYDQTRKLVRIGRLEFLLDPALASQFNFTAVRKERGVSTRPELKKAKAGGH
ncbi:MAG TPA: hypothetical protein VE981_12045 [Planctomycetota bacterium]|nr:hypothetical protein [Planctomycetota bacterium]